MEVGANQITTEAQICHQQHHDATGAEPKPIPFQDQSAVVHQLQINPSAHAGQLFMRSQGLPQDQQSPDPHTSLGIVELSVSMQTASFSNLPSVERPRIQEPQAGSAPAKLPPLLLPGRVTQISVAQNRYFQEKRKLPPIGADAESKVWCYFPIIIPE